MELYLFMFKFVITLLLLKMVLAIVFESYKRVVGSASKKARTVMEDLQELGMCCVHSPQISPLSAVAMS